MFLWEILAIGGAISIAISGMLIHELNGRMSLFRLAVWQMCSATAMTATLSLVTGGWRSLHMTALGYLSLSSVFGIMIASTAYFAAIYSAGPRVTALLFSLTAPITLVLGYLVFGETVSERQALGAGLVLLGIVLAIGLRARPGEAAVAATESQQAAAVRGRVSRVTWSGVCFGLITALGQSIGILAARPAMASGTEPFTAMAVRAGLASLFFLLLTRFPLAVFRRSELIVPRHIILVVLAGFLGTGLGMSMVMAALGEGHVGIVSTLSSMTPVAILPMIWLRTGRSPRPVAWIGALLALCGTALISA